MKDGKKGHLVDVRRETTTASAISKPHRHLSQTTCIQPTWALGSDFRRTLLVFAFPSEVEGVALAREDKDWLASLEDDGCDVDWRGVGSDGTPLSRSPMFGRSFISGFEY
jgi:hypothetical protein